MGFGVHIEGNLTSRNETGAVPFVPPLRIDPDYAADAGLPSGLKLLNARRRMRRYVRLSALLFDVFAITAAFVCGNLIRFGDPLHDQGVNLLWVILPIYLAIAANTRAYNITSIAIGRRGGGRAALALLIALSAIGLVVFFLKAGPDFSRAVLGLGAAFGLVLLPLGRLGLGAFAAKFFGRSTSCEVLIEDDVRAPARLSAVLLNADQHRLSPQLDNPAMLDRLGRCVVNADRVIVSCSPSRRKLWAMALKGVDAKAEIIISDLDEFGAIGLDEFNGQSTLVVGAAPLGVIDRALKRIFDLSLTIAAMPIVLPLMGIVAIAVRLDSRGPILFAQERVGLGNRIFRIYKFRSMYSEKTDDKGDRSTRRGDERITRVGRFIRATSLDELPQLFNVLAGSMSVVGPRPHPLLCKADDRLFWDIDLRYWHRHVVKPGLTGLAQVRGLRGATELESQFTDRLQADLEYLSGWSIWRDFSILFATFRVLIHRNAF